MLIFGDEAPTRLAMGLGTGIDWRPGVGDPSIAGWLTVALYAIATAMAYRCAQADRLNRRGWIAIGIFEMLLCINKQLDLQVLFMQVGRYLARHENWYQDRREVQAIFVAALATMFVAIIVATHVRMKDKPTPFRLALVGASVDLIFICMRAAAFHHVGTVPRTGPVGMLTNGYLENLGILIVIGGAWFTLRSGRWRRQNTLRQSSPRYSRAENQGDT